MSIGQGILRIAKDTQITGKVLDCKRIEVSGSMEGEVEADRIVVHEGGEVYGDIKAGDAEIYGTVQGQILIKNLIDIRSSGNVSGNIKYGQLALQNGAELEATLSNIPPKLSGDFDLHVRRGHHVKITTTDLTAIDPDDTAEKLTFNISNPVRGFVALRAYPKQPITKFSQSDIEAGDVMFVHDGSKSNDAFFDVMVSDAEGANSGDPKTLKVHII